MPLTHHWIVKKSDPFAIIMDAEITEIPDGGWGWVIVAAVALINMSNQSILSVYGLLFGTQLEHLQQDTFTTALITNLNSLALNFSGLFIGPAIKSFKPRNVAASGCITVSFGLLLCAFATAGWHFIVGYSLFVGFGLGLIAPSTFVAINSYFSSKRGRAVGVSLAGAGLGQVFIPHVVRFFLDHYGFREAVLAMSVLSLSGLLGAFFLKPLNANKNSLKHNNRRHIKLLLEDSDQPKKDHVLEIKINTNIAAEEAVNNKLYQEHKHCMALLTPKDKIYQETTIQVVKHEASFNKLTHRLVQALDLELLKDPIFWNMIIGMALVYTSSINFSMIFPSFLQYSANLSRSTTATCMSIMAGADIVCRLLLPCITDKLKIPYRLIFLLGTMGLLVSRAALAESSDFITIVVMSVFTGMTKSATVLNNNLTISAYCKPEKLPGGLGLNMISKGVLVITVGQLSGWIRDLTNSYILCLHAQNCLLLLVIIAWAPEMLYNYRKQSLAKRRAIEEAFSNSAIRVTVAPKS
uniref:Major facilitator superfamily (MFS) profile domain-containing protein n=1 Tax=Glossina brevipalpis TaxID=37001 RepID=A0A1A9WDY0_9MUSC